jgi:tetratricopeptide (TPR) repeat protein
MIFNKGVIYEKMANITAAIETYKDLIKKNCLFVDSYLRLANLYSTLGNFKSAISQCGEAQEYLEKSLRVGATLNSPDVLYCVRANIVLESGENLRALEIFKELNVRFRNMMNNTDDSYSVLSQGRIYY